ncbi:hypothetical protein FCM35_KLT20478 [Carex littledalei]|uniref:Uncharacterized protein n=1 Tax=Carex littledalei TaxID=544730 RepID=A0A833RAS7_9POAL|nr:hypothetical protein FCM35_KLT20478 [Carex littledalei]
MERKRESRARFRLGSEMEEPITGKRSKTALVVGDSHSDKCHPNFSVPTIGEPFVKYKRPRYDFEKWDWMLFQWPHDRADANFEMTHTDLDASFEADNKRFEEFIYGKQRQIEEQEIELPLDQQNSTKNCTQNLLGDSGICPTDAST